MIDLTIHTVRSIKLSPTQPLPGLSSSFRRAVIEYLPEGDGDPVEIAIVLFGDAAEHLEIRDDELIRARTDLAEAQRKLDRYERVLAQIAALDATDALEDAVELAEEAVDTETVSYWQAMIAKETAA